MNRQPKKIPQLSDKMKRGMKQLQTQPGAKIHSPKTRKR